MKKQKRNPHVLPAGGALGGAGPTGLVAKMYEAAHAEKAPPNPLRPAPASSNYKGAGCATTVLDVLLLKSGVSPHAATEADVRRVSVNASSDIEARYAPAVLALVNSGKWITFAVVPQGQPSYLESQARERARELPAYQPGQRLPSWAIPSL